MSERTNMKGSTQKGPSKSRTPKSTNVNGQDKENVRPQVTGGSRAQLPQIQNAVANTFTDGEGGSSSTSTRPTLSPISAGKRNSSHSQEPPKKKRNEAAKARSDRDDCNESFTSTGSNDDHTGDISMESTVATLSVAERLYIDPSEITRCPFLWKGCDFPETFYQYQMEAVAIVNRPVRVNLCNVHQFFAVNCILDLTREEPPEVLGLVFNGLKDKFTVKVRDFDDTNIQDACSAVEVLIATKSYGEQHIRHINPDKLRIFLRDLHSSLKASLLDSMTINEAVFSLLIVKKFWDYQFPESNRYTLSWGGELQEQGSERRRKKGKGRKLDAAVKMTDNLDYTLCHIEIKRPNVVFKREKYLTDYQKIAIMCKDTIDNAAASGCNIRECSAVQYYGNHMFVYTMTWKDGIYFWSRLGQSVIPFDRSCFSTVYPVLRLLHSLKIFLDSIDTTMGKKQAIPSPQFPASPHSPSKRKPSKKNK